MFESLGVMIEFCFVFFPPPVHKGRLIIKSRITKNSTVLVRTLAEGLFSNFCRESGCGEKIELISRIKAALEPKPFSPK
jgi:hypothetical protein